MPLNLNYPSYKFPFKLELEIVLSFIKNEPRCLKVDASRAIKGIAPPIIIKGKQNIPKNGPALVTINHYSRPGFFIGWAALAIAAQLPDQHVWLMTNAWTNRTAGVDQIRTWITKRIFNRLAEMYGAITTPPMPPSPDEIIERVMSIRRVMHIISEKPEAVICIAPEGQDTQDGMIGFPPAGTGRFIYHIQKVLHQIIPVGIWEENSRLIICFGLPYTIESIKIKENIDYEVSDLVMQKLSRLLPHYLISSNH